ncbi:hypothetical protein [Pasteurella multocida]|uniref:hypothetical protein n=1 Tax=Pasteurella multocida TaxID=747 RepID=UPI0008F9F044|nr:hypothetical protein [Pasteurella multocida]MDA5618789.1 hypothetical protein [Pasteurella multocida subsp. multocida]MDC4235983.1 hypothetical protein [Pasteurella multocida]MDY0633112.1 hypothetical protein [Pasteurella multocida]OIQ15303.1 hypothetical protein UR07_01325 [Pasteurella multocida subsp. multocida]PNW19744.1 hypothetical protein AP056_11280 [Pasteurella multocida subsp. multocida]
MFGNNLQVMDGKKYVILECRFKEEWQTIRETREGVTQGEALEIYQYWIKYKRLDKKQLMIVEVPDIVRPR